MQTDIAVTTADAIVIRGHNLADDLMGSVGFTDMMVLTMLGRLPTSQERTVVDAIAVSLMDHGLTPSSLSARLTLLGAPESFQAAVAAGLLGAGSTFLGGMAAVSRMLAEAAADLPEDAPDAVVADLAERIVTLRLADGQKVPGVGHNVHTRADPRVERLRQIVDQAGCYDKHWRLMDRIPAALHAATGHRLPLNNVGAVGASIAALHFPAEMGRGIALTARAAGLTAHLLEEAAAPMAQQVWEHVLTAAQSDDGSRPA